MTNSAAGELLAGWFDDAGLYPPAALTIAQAVTAHARHRVSWYDHLVATLVSNDARLLKIDACAGRLGLTTLDVSVVVPAGLDTLPAALATVHRCQRLRLRAIEVAIGPTELTAAARAAATLAERGIPLYVEVPRSQLTETRAHQLRTHGVRLKLRAGGTSVDTFTPEAELAPMIVNCAAELLPFTCVTGVSRAIRHRDPATLFQRHGFLNIALATLTAVRTGSHAAVRDVLAERDQYAIAQQLQNLAPRDVVALRTMLVRVGSSHLAESVADLSALGIIAEQ